LDRVRSEPPSTTFANGEYLVARQHSIVVVRAYDERLASIDMITVTIVCQILLLAYHQVTTHVDFYPFNGARNYSRGERLAEAGINLILMSLAPVGFVLHIHGLMIYGVVYYYFLFAAELIIWWIPYFTEPVAGSRVVYNFLLSCVTSDFSAGDALTRWYGTYKRLHGGTIVFLPSREGRPVPNVEHTILHAWTLVTAVTTTLAVFL